MAEETSANPPVETIPSKAGDISAIASAHAPFLYFDLVPNFGCVDGVVKVTLEALRNLLPVPGQPVMTDRVVVAHLRMSVPAAAQLRHALDQALLMAALSPSDQKN